MQIKIFNVKGLIHMSEAIKNPPFSQTEIKNAADELYNQLVIETEEQSAFGAN